jgi:DNA-binding transcriptional LysR family regulator
MAALPIMRDAFILAAPAGHRLARPEGVVLADIGAEPVIWSSHKRGPRLYDRMLSACEARGFSPRIVMETPASDITMKFVAAEMGVGFVTESLIGHQPPNVAMVRIHDFHVVMQLSLVWRAAAPGEALATFIDFLAPRIERPEFEKLEP